MRFFRSFMYLLIPWLHIATFCSTGAAGRQREHNDYTKNPSWSVRDRNVFVRRWREGVRHLYLSDRSQWPEVLRLDINTPSPFEGLKGRPTFGGTSSSKVMPTLQQAPLRNEDALPPMDESVVNELSQPNMPTFQEFHAKVLGENQNKRRLELPDDPVNVISSRSNKDNVGSAAHSNLSKHPYRNDEGVAHASPASTTANTDATTSVPSSTGSDAFIAASEVIHPSYVMENGGNGGANGKHVQGTGHELRVIRNIAASECGAKLLQASPSAKHAPSILVDNNDEYMNQPCASEKWFIIETCEPVQLSIIQIANYELFSSRCKTFRVFVSDRYPAKQWEQIGIFQGQDVKGLQTFHVGGSATGRLIKYVKFEILDHYGNEHFCPITMVRLFGLSSDEMDEPGLPPPPPSRSSHPGDIGTTPGESESGLEGNSDTSVLNNTRLETAMDAQSSTKRTSTTASKKRSGRKKFKKNKTSPTALDPPINGSSVDEEVENGDCVKGQKNAVTPTVRSGKSTGLWQHATRFILGVLQSAIGGRSSLTLPPVSNAAVINRTDTPTTTEPTSDDFYSVIYIFSASSSAATPPPSKDARSRGLWHLARCLVALSSSSPPLRSLAAPHRAWADCTATQFLLNLTSISSKDPTDSLLQFQRLAAAYRNLTSAFGRWPAELMGRQMGKELPVPEFLKSQVTPKSVMPTPSKPVIEDAETLEQETVGSEASKTEQSPSPVESKPTSSPPQLSSTPPMPPPETAVGSHEDDKDGNLSPQSLQPSPPVQCASSKEGDDEKPSAVEDAKVMVETPAPTESPQKQELEMETVMAEGTEGEREMVLPAAMGGSWKETMYMRLNNKVLQLQSDVSVSMRYLEELSQSYKRQTERLSASFNLTTAWLKATAKGAEERDLLQQERIDALEAQLTKLLHILADGGVVVLAPSPSREAPDSSRDLTSTTTSSSVPHFRKPDSSSASSISGVDLQSILWSVFFQSPATASPSSSLSTPSKRVYGSSSASAAAPASGTGNGTGGSIESCKTTSLSSLFGRTPATSGSARPSAVGARLPPPASLLFRRRQPRGQKEAVVDATGPMAHLPGVSDAWMFILVVSQHLRNFLLSETFRLWLLHLCLAVLAQAFVYVIFLRSALRRCLPLSSLALSPSSYEICSTLPTITDSNYDTTNQGAGGCEVEKKTNHPRSRSSSTVAAPSKAEDSLTPSSPPLPSNVECDVVVDPFGSTPVRSASSEGLDVESRQRGHAEEVEEELEAVFDPFASSLVPEVDGDRSTQQPVPTAGERRSRNWRKKQRRRQKRARCNLSSLVETTSATPILSVAF